MGVWIWLGISIVAIITEILTNQLFAVWFAVSGLISLILTTFTFAWYVTVPVFIAVSAILVLFVRRGVLKLVSSADVTPAEDNNEQPPV